MEPEEWCGILLGVFVVFCVVGGVWSAHVQRSYEAKARQMQRTPNADGISPEDLKRWYSEALDEIVDERLKTESSTEHGERVFLSHYIKGGRFCHWVLHTHGYKYELRQSGRDESRNKKYTVSIKPSTFDNAAYTNSVIKNHSPEIGHFFYSMIGWTTLTKKEVDHVFNEQMPMFGKYDLFSNNCQHFLQQFAYRAVTKKAADWDWFQRNSLRETYRFERYPTLGDHVVFAAMWAERLKREKHLWSASEIGRAESLIRELEKFVVENTPSGGSMGVGDHGNGAAGDGGGGGGGGGGGD